jgi:hypothetical protein
VTPSPRAQPRQPSPTADNPSRPSLALEWIHHEDRRARCYGTNMAAKKPAKKKRTMPAALKIYQQLMAAAKGKTPAQVRAAIALLTKKGK